MNLVSEISNELAIAILVEKRHRESLEQRSAKELIARISLALGNCEGLEASDQEKKGGLKNSCVGDSATIL